MGRRNRVARVGYRPQHGKNRKRPRGWHRGRAAGRSFERLPGAVRRLG